MGAWGMGNFQNDDASDWVYTLLDNGEGVLKATLRTATDLYGQSEQVLDEYAGTEVLAAAEVVAALLGKPSKDLPEDVSEWVKGKGFGPELASTALQAVEVVLTNSELKELWEESNRYTVWKGIVNDLKERLS